MPKKERSTILQTCAAVLYYAPTLIRNNFLSTLNIERNYFGNIYFLITTILNAIITVWSTFIHIFCANFLHISCVLKYSGTCQYSDLYHVSRTLGWV